MRSTPAALSASFCRSVTWRLVLTLTYPTVAVMHLVSQKSARCTRCGTKFWHGLLRPGDLRKRLPDHPTVRVSHRPEIGTPLRGPAGQGFRWVGGTPERGALGHLGTSRALAH